MQILHLECSADEKDIVIAELYSRGTSGIIEEEATNARVGLQAFFDTAFPADDFAAHGPWWEPADETNWVRAIMDSWDPIPVGEHFFLAPDWRDDPTPEGRIRLVVRPGVALGTGYHATTQMCLEAMEQYLKPGDRLLDLGTGSGILSHAAWLLGEREITAADIDHQAIESATENLARAKVPVKLITGSTSALPDNCADFLVANISADGLIELSTEIVRCLSATGIAVLSGFPPDRLGDVQLGFELEGFHHVDDDQREDWACLVMSRT
jgi:ribosomal protein L11 methyltransferase